MLEVNTAVLYMALAQLRLRYVVLFKKRKRLAGKS